VESQRDFLGFPDVILTRQRSIEGASLPFWLEMVRASIEGLLDGMIIGFLTLTCKAGVSGSTEAVGDA
jgi:hypothetical protein